MYFSFDTRIENRICHVDNDILSEIETTYCMGPTLVISEFTAVANRIMHDFNLHEPSNFEESIELYHTLVTYLDKNMN